MRFHIILCGISTAFAGLSVSPGLDSTICESLDCPSGATCQNIPADGRCFQSIQTSSTMDWESAWRTCYSHAITLGLYGRLAPPTTSTIVDAIDAAINQSVIVWLGGYYQNYLYYWAQDYMHVTSMEGVWPWNSTNIQYTGGQCMAMNLGLSPLQLSLISCLNNGQVYPMCEFRERDYTFVTFGNCEYTNVRMALNYDDSATVCREIGAGLPIIKDNITNDGLIAASMNYGYESVANKARGHWIGLNDKITEAGDSTTSSNWIWEDGVSAGADLIVYKNWKSGQPNDPTRSSDQDCVYLYLTYNQWIDTSCYTKYMWPLCQMNCQGPYTGTSNLATTTTPETIKTSTVSFSRSTTRISDTSTLTSKTLNLPTTNAPLFTSSIVLSSTKITPILPNTYFETSLNTISTTKMTVHLSTPTINLSVFLSTISTILPASTTSVKNTSATTFSTSPSITKSTTTFSTTATNTLTTTTLLFEAIETSVTTSLTKATTLISLSTITTPSTTEIPIMTSIFTVTPFSTSLTEKMTSEVNFIITSATIALTTFTGSINTSANPSTSTLSSSIPSASSVNTVYTTFSTSILRASTTFGDSRSTLLSSRKTYKTISSTAPLKHSSWTTTFTSTSWTTKFSQVVMSTSKIRTTYRKITRSNEIIVSSELSKVTAVTTFSMGNDLPTSATSAFFNNWMTSESSTFLIISPESEPVTLSPSIAEIAKKIAEVTSAYKSNSATSNNQIDNRTTSQIPDDYIKTSKIYETEPENEIEMSQSSISPSTFLAGISTQYISSIARNTEQNLSKDMRASSDSSSTTSDESTTSPSINVGIIDDEPTIGVDSNQIDITTITVTITTITVVSEKLRIQSFSSPKIDESTYLKRESAFKTSTELAISHQPIITGNNQNSDRDEDLTLPEIWNPQNKTSFQSRKAATITVSSTSINTNSTDKVTNFTSIIGKVATEVGNDNVIAPVYPLNSAEEIAVKVLQSLGCTYMLGILGGTVILLTLVIRDNSHERFIHLNQEVALFIAHVLILTLRQRTDLPFLCKLAAFGLQSTFLTTFVFMCLEALQTYAILSNVSSFGSVLTRMRMLMIGWIPSLLISGLNYFIHAESLMSTWSCWLNVGHKMALLTALPLLALTSVALIMAEASKVDDYAALPLSNASQN